MHPMKYFRAVRFSRIKRNSVRTDPQQTAAGLLHRRRTGAAQRLHPHPQKSERVIFIELLGPTPLLRGVRVSRRGARVRLVVGSGEVVGRLVRIGADHVDVAVDPEGGVRSHRAPGAGGAGVISVMTAAIEVLRSR